MKSGRVGLKLKDSLGTGAPGRENSMSKGPGAGPSLERLRNRSEAKAGVAGVEE